jgi:glycosyltransferase involved in cell wall biosynthesis
VSPHLPKLGRSGQDPAPGTLQTAMLELARNGPAPLRAGPPSDERSPHVACIIPSFRRGSGGHATIVHLLLGLKARGVPVSVWLEDCEDRHADERPAATARSFAEFFGAADLELHSGFDSWAGADIVLATGWQTVPRALLLGEVCARSYLVQDHEPDFYAVSSEALWARDTYRQGLHCVAASPWLAELLSRRYEAQADHFDLAVDHSVYHPHEIPRRDDLVVFYARTSTPRRAVGLGLLALAELARRRPGVEIALFGEDRSPGVPFEHTWLGILPAERLAELYSQATVGMVLSLTNPSLVNLEMMACGLPCVELASEPMFSSFSGAGPLRMVRPEPLALCDAIETFLDEPQRRSRISEDGLELTAQRTWERASGQVYRSLLSALAAEQQQQPEAQAPQKPEP